MTSSDDGIVNMKRMVSTKETREILCIVRCRTMRADRLNADRCEGLRTDSESEWRWIDHNAAKEVL